MAISIRLPSDLAVLTGHSKTYYITEAIFEDPDGLEKLNLAERELKGVRVAVSSTVPLIDVMKL